MASQPPKPPTAPRPRRERSMLCCVRGTVWDSEVLLTTCWRGWISCPSIRWPPGALLPLTFSFRRPGHPPQLSHPWALAFAVPSVTTLFPFAVTIEIPPSFQAWFKSPVFQEFFSLCLRPVTCVSPPPSELWAMGRAISLAGWQPLKSGRRAYSTLFPPMTSTRGPCTQ